MKIHHATRADYEMAKAIWQSLHPKTVIILQTPKSAERVKNGIWIDLAGSPYLIANGKGNK